MWCKHKWEKRSEVILDSGYEQLLRGAGKIDPDGDLSILMFKKAVVLVFVCEKCGKLHRIVESNPI